jgi:transposase-like protein
VLTVVPEESGSHDDQPGGPPAGSTGLLIDEIVREGARRMFAEALQAEVDAYIAAFRDERDEHGRRLVVRNGTRHPREMLTAAGTVEVVAPRVNDRRTDPDTGECCRFSSAILPPWVRKTPKVTQVLPLLYLHGLSSGDFVLALGQFLGSWAGLSAPVITKLTETWTAEQRTFAARDLSQVDYVYLWATDPRQRAPRGAQAVLAGAGGVRADGPKELVALADGYRESTESWAQQDRWRAVNGPHLVALVRAGATFVIGKLVERPDDHTIRKPPKDLRPQVLTISPTLLEGPPPA